MWSGCCANENPASRTVGGVCEAVTVQINYGGGVEVFKKLEEEEGWDVDPASRGDRDH